MAPSDMERALQRGWMLRYEENKDPVTGEVVSRAYTAKHPKDGTVASGDSLYELLNRLDKFDSATQ